MRTVGGNATAAFVESSADIGEPVVAEWTPLSITVTLCPGAGVVDVVLVAVEPVVEELVADKGVVVSLAVGFAVGFTVGLTVGVAVRSNDSVEVVSMDGAQVS